MRFLNISQEEANIIFKGAKKLEYHEAGLVMDLKSLYIIWQNAGEIPENIYSKVQEFKFDMDGDYQFFDFQIIHGPGQVEKAQEISANYFNYVSGMWAGQDRYNRKGLSGEEADFGECVISWKIPPLPDPMPPAEGGIEPSRSQSYNILYQDGDVGIVIRYSKTQMDGDHRANTILRALHQKKNISIAFEKTQAILKEPGDVRGVLKSLQVKMDQFEKHHYDGKFKPAQGVLEAYLHELSALKDKKHLSEEIYQKLKSEGDALMTAIKELLKIYSK